MLEAKTPVLVTCAPPASFVPKVAPLKGILYSKDKPYKVWDHQKVGANKDELGLPGSPTQVKRTYSPPIRGEVEIMKGDIKDVTRELVNILIDRKVVGGEE